MLDAGLNTDHRGQGFCSYHGGNSGADDVGDLLASMGLTSLIDRAAKLSTNDLEQLYHTTNTALVLERARLIQQLGDPSLSPKEQADTTGSIQKIDNILKAYKREAKGAKAEAGKRQADDREITRLKDLEEKLG